MPAIAHDPAPDPDAALAFLLESSGICTADDIGRATAVAKAEHTRLDRVLIRLGFAEEAALLGALCSLHGFKRLDRAKALPDTAAIAQLGLAYLSGRGALPILSDETENLVVAVSDPLDRTVVTEISFHLERKAVVRVATQAELRELLAEGSTADTAVAASPDQRVARDTEELRRAGQDGPVIRFVQDMLASAVQVGASDLHVEMSDEYLNLRFRINGLLVPQKIQPGLDAATVIARLKVMAGLNVAERRLPQDGRLQAVIAGRKVDFRFSSLPTHMGESVVARVLDPRALRLGWERLGFAPQVMDWIKAILAWPSGLFLVTGPTGSGKTTTLYTALSHLNTPARKIVTVEDPVEYNLPGVQQIQVQEEIGLTFARVLRGVLRHDPNVIMVGEIRDAETAEIAIRAAQVGRLVLSTLHTNSAAGAVHRLIDLGVPRFLIDDVLRGVLGQELQMVLCEACSGAGCPVCAGTGVSDRKLAVETWPFDGDN